MRKGGMKRRKGEREGGMRKRKKGREANRGGREG